MFNFYLPSTFSLLIGAFNDSILSISNTMTYWLQHPQTDVMSNVTFLTRDIAIKYFIAILFSVAFLLTYISQLQWWHTLIPFLVSTVVNNVRSWSKLLLHLVQGNFVIKNVAVAQYVLQSAGTNNAWWTSVHSRYSGP